MLAKTVLVSSLAAAASLQVNPASISRRDVFAALAVSPVVFPAVANAAEGALPIWSNKRPNMIEKPLSVTKGCTVLKPCAKGASFPYSEVANQPRQGPGPAKKK
jgi:hypothetical protein